MAIFFVSSSVNYALFTDNRRTIDAQYTHYFYHFPEESLSFWYGLIKTEKGLHYSCKGFLRIVTFLIGFLKRLTSFLKRLTSFLKELTHFLIWLTVFLKRLSCFLKFYTINSSSKLKIAAKCIFSCTIQKNVLPLHREPAPRGVWHHRWRVADILKGVYWRLVLMIWNFATFIDIHRT